MGLFAKLLAWFNCLFSKAQAMPTMEPPPPELRAALSPYRMKIQQLWRTCVVDMNHANQIMWAANEMILHRARYEHVAKAVNMPWYVIGAIHMRESGFNFKKHFSNGDDLFNEHGVPQKTVHVPKGLGPYADWESSAIGAIMHMHFNENYHWDLVNTLENLEIWNGLGYKNLGLLSPFIWSMTNHHKMGKYSSDGHYDPTLIDKQVGCAALFYALNSQGIDLDERFL